MYIPHYYLNTNLDAATRFIRAFPFAVLSSTQDSICVTHTPLLAEKEGEQLILLGHIAKRNPQSALHDGNEVLCIFNGENTYISAGWYKGNDDVPTWNYRACHVKGTWCSLNEDSDKLEVLSRTVKMFEAHRKNPWTFDDVEPSRLSMFLKQIQAFKIEIHTVDFAEKLSQDKSLNELHAIVDSLKDETHNPSSKSMKALLEEQIKTRTAQK